MSHIISFPPDRFHCVVFVWSGAGGMKSVEFFACLFCFGERECVCVHVCVHVSSRACVEGGGEETLL